MKPVALIIRTAGTNCDRELAHAFELAGASATVVHVNRLIGQPSALEHANLIGIPGGFSYGDDIAAGRIFANRLRYRLLDPLRAAIGRGVPLIGICNGFQVLVKLGLLPDPHGERPGRRQEVTLCDNASGRFVAGWVGLTVPKETMCIWTRGLERFELPIAHGEGRFVPASDTVLRRLRDGRQIAIGYAPTQAGMACTGIAGGNPNGSVGDVAGICDPSGLVLGLMPHPERYTQATQHPMWTSGAGIEQVPPGLRLFQNAVRHVCRRQPVAP